MYLLLPDGTKLLEGTSKTWEGEQLREIGLEPAVNPPPASTFRITKIDREHRIITLEAIHRRATPDNPATRA